MMMRHEEITRKIIGHAMQVHRTLGNGFQEVIYQRALEIEFASDGLSFVREKEINIWYKGKVVGTRRVDFFVEETIMVELKAFLKLEEAHIAQALNYCEVYNMEVGLLINFGATSLQFKRIHNNSFNKKSLYPFIP